MFATVVLGLDGSESSDRALAYAEKLAKEHASKIHVVHVVELIAGRGGGPVHLDEDELKAKIKHQVEGLSSSGITADLEMHSAMAGGPAHIIAEAATRVGADLIVTGSRGHTAVAGVIVGSVVQRLLHVAHCPILVVTHATPPRTTSHEERTATGAAG